MAVLTETRTTTHTANGTSTTFAYTFRILEASHLRVYLDGIEAGGYSVTNVGNNEGGEIVFASAPANGVKIDIIRVVPHDQQTLYGAYSAFPAQVIEDDFDKRAMVDQQTRDDQERALRIPRLETLAELPAAASRTNKYMQWSADGRTLLLIENLPAGTPLSAEIIGDLIYPVIQAETDAGVTVTKSWFEWYDPRRYGMDPAADASTNHTALQGAINACAHGGGGVVPLPSGIHDLGANAVYLYYDEANNPNFKNADENQGRIDLVGKGRGDELNQTRNIAAGSVLKFSGTGGIKVGDPTYVAPGGVKNWRVWLRQFAVWANTTVYPILLQVCPRGVRVKDITVVQEGTGGGLLVEDCWFSEVAHVFAWRVGTSGAEEEGITIRARKIANGIYNIKNLRSDGFAYPIVFGNRDGNGAGMIGVEVDGVEGFKGIDGITFAQGASGIEASAIWSEGNTNAGVRVYYGASGIEFHSIYIPGGAGTNSEADFILGKSGAGTTENFHRNILIRSLTCVDIQAVGLKRYSSANCASLVIETPTFTSASPAGKTAISLVDAITGGDAVQHGIEIIRPHYTVTFGTEIDFPNRVDRLVQRGTLGKSTMQADVEMAGAGRIQFGSTQTTVGAAGGASAPPATPTGYIKIKDSGGAERVIPYYDVS